jgi:hypothetical protein
VSLLEAVAVGTLTRTVEVTVWNGTTRLATLDVADGTITDKLGDAIRRHLDITLTVDSVGTLIPRTRSDLLQPLGNEIRVRYGVTIDGTTVWADQGVYGIEKPSSADDGNLTSKLTGVDRAASIQARRWVDPFTIANATNSAIAIKNILNDRRPGLAYNLAATTYTTPTTVLGVERDNDPWKDAQDIATSAGMLLSFDPAGTVVLEPELDPATVAPQWEFIEGPDCTMTSVSRTLDAEKTRNGVVVVGEGSGVTTPVRGEAWDTDPTSPTYYLGPFGKRPFFLSSPLIKTQGQADAVAAAQLPKVLSVGETVELTARANPFLRAGQVVEVQRGRAGVSGKFLVDSVTLPLDVGEMRVSLRERRA